MSEPVRASERKDSFWFNVAGLICLAGVLLVGIYLVDWQYDTHPTPRSLENQRIVREGLERYSHLQDDLCAEVVQVRQQPAAVAALTSEQWARLVECELRLQAKND